MLCALAAFFGFCAKFEKAKRLLTTGKNRLVCVHTRGECKALFPWRYASQ